MQHLGSTQSLTIRGKDWFASKTKKWHQCWWWRAESAVIGIAIFLGLISASLQQLHESSRLAEYQTQFATVEIVVAAQDLKTGSILGITQLSTTSILQKNLSKNMLSERQRNMIIGRRLLIDLKQGDPILLTSVQGFADPATIASKIPQGQRFFTLAVSDHAANNGFLKPNDHVDVFAHIELPGRGLTTFNLLQDVTLISVGKSTIEEGGAATNATSVSFFIDASVAPLMAFAQHRGTFALSLRNPKDLQTRTEDSRGIDMAEFLDHRLVAKASGGGELKVNIKRTNEKIEEVQSE